MSIIADSRAESSEIVLYFAVDDVTAWIVEGLPQPSFIYYGRNGGGVIGWQIVGFDGTKAVRDFVEDAIERVEITLDARFLEYGAGNWSEDRARIDEDRVVELRELVRNCRSLSLHRHAPTRADSFDDYIFWAIKLWTEDELRVQGEGAPVFYNKLEKWAMAEFSDKERSTIRAKCRSVWNWYEARSWTIPKRKTKKSKEEIEMTRVENAKKMAKRKAENTRRKIMNVITGLYASDYKRKSGKWNISKIAKDLNLSRTTVTQHLKHLEQQQQKAS